MSSRLSELAKFHQNIYLFQELCERFSRLCCSWGGVRPSEVQPKNLTLMFFSLQQFLESVAQDQFLSAQVCLRLKENPYVLEIIKPVLEPFTDLKPYAEIGRYKQVDFYCRYKHCIRSRIIDYPTFFFFHLVLPVDVLAVLFLWHILLSLLLCVKETRNLFFSVVFLTKSQLLHSAVTGFFSLKYFLTLSYIYWQDKDLDLWHVCMQTYRVTASFKG